MLGVELHRAGIRREGYRKMEALKAGTPQGRTDNMSPESSEVYGRQTQVVLATSDLDEARCPAEAGTASHGAKHTHLAQAWEEPRGDPGEGGLVAGLVAYSCRQCDR